MLDIGYENTDFYDLGRNNIDCYIFFIIFAKKKFTI